MDNLQSFGIVLEDLRSSLSSVVDGYKDLNLDSYDEEGIQRHTFHLTKSWMDETNLTLSGWKLRTSDFGNGKNEYVYVACRVVEDSIKKFNVDSDKSDIFRSELPDFCDLECSTEEVMEALDCSIEFIEKADSK